MRQMVWHEMQSFAQRTSKQLLDSRAYLAEPQMEGFLNPRIPPFGAITPLAQLGVKRVGDVIDIARGEPGMLQAKANRALGELMRVIPIGLLAVLDTIEPFLLDGGDKLAVDEQRSR